MRPVISVIVPIYNAAKYLKQNVRSVLRQTYREFELILVNDGSTDKSLSVCKSFKDERIVIIDKKNEGSEKTRLVGLQQARGKYICFIDADDWVVPDYLQQLLIPAIKYDVDLVCMNAYKVLDRYGIIKKKLFFYSDFLYKKDDLYSYHHNFIERLFSNNVWGKLYKKALFEQCQLKVAGIHWGDDAFLNMQISPFISSCYMNSFYGYYYRYGGSTFAYDERFWPNLSKLYWLRKEYAENYDVSIVRGLKVQLFNIFVSNVDLLIRFSRSSKKEILSFIQDVLNSSYYEEINDIDININDEILLRYFREKNAEKIYDYIYRNINRFATFKTNVYASLFYLFN